MHTQCINIILKIVASVLILHSNIKAVANNYSCLMQHFLYSNYYEQLSGKYLNIVSKIEEMNNII